MRSIFIGLLFVFLDFNLNIGASQIGLIPDFVGYAFMLAGLKDLADKSDRFIKVRPFSTGMLIYTAILYAFDLLGITVSLGSAVSFILGLVSTLISFYISYGIVMGIKDMELRMGIFLNAEKLFAVWRIYAVLSLIIYLLFFIPVLGWLGIIAGLVAGIVFLVYFNNTKRLYEQHFQTRTF